MIDANLPIDEVEHLPVRSDRLNGFDRRDLAWHEAGDFVSYVKWKAVSQGVAAEAYRKGYQDPGNLHSKDVNEQWDRVTRGRPQALLQQGF